MDMWLWQLARGTWDGVAPPPIHRDWAATPVACPAGQTWDIQTGVGAGQLLNSAAFLSQEGSSVVMMGGQHLSLAPDDSVLVPAGTS